MRCWGHPHCSLTAHGNVIPCKNLRCRIPVISCLWGDHILSNFRFWGLLLAGDKTFLIGCYLTVRHLTVISPLHINFKAATLEEYNAWRHCRRVPLPLHPNSPCPTPSNPCHAGCWLKIIIIISGMFTVLEPIRPMIKPHLRDQRYRLCLAILYLIVFLLGHNSVS